MVHLIADLIFVLLGAFIIWRCVHNGFIKCLFKFARTLLAILIAWLLVNPIAPIIGEKFIEEPVYDFVFDKINAVYLEAEDSFDAEKVIEDLPSFLTAGDVEEKLNDLEGDGEELVASISEEITEPIVTIISSVIAFVVLFIVAFILLSIALHLLNALIDKIKFIHLANKILGGVWGLLIACVLWFFIASVMEIFLSDFSIYSDSVVIKFFGNFELLKALGIWN